MDARTKEAFTILMSLLLEVVRAIDDDSAREAAADDLAELRELVNSEEETDGS